MKLSETPALEPAVRDCPNCGGNRYDDLRLAPAPWKIGQCRRCGFVYLNMAPSYQLLSEELAWSNSYKQEARRRAEQRPVFTWFDHRTRWRLHLAPRPETWRFMSKRVRCGRIVELGCSDGRNLMRLPADVTPYGVEIGKLRAEEADARLRSRGGRCLHAPATEGLRSFEDRWFDGAMLNSFLEHEAAPADLLSILHAKLKLDGLAIVKVPNFASWNAAVMKSAWCGIRIPDHVNYFTPRSLATMARKAGFAISFPRLANLPTNDNFWAFLRKAA